MAEAILPDLASSQIVQLHPLAVIGFTGALLNALQLLPVGRLDGGRLATATLGQRSHPLVSIVPGVVVTAATAQGCCLQGCCLHAPPPRHRQQPQPLGP